MEKIEIKDIDIQYRAKVLEIFSAGRKKYVGNFYITVAHGVPYGHVEQGLNEAREDLPCLMFRETAYKYCIDDNSLYLLWNIGPEETY